LPRIGTGKTERTTKSAYDAGGDLTSLTDGNNKEISYVEDGGDRVTTRTDALSRSDSYVYDTNSKPSLSLLKIILSTKIGTDAKCPVDATLEQ
jgi:YD repeat-containing protein